MAALYFSRFRRDEEYPMRQKSDPAKLPLVQYFLPMQNERKRDPVERLGDSNEIYYTYSVQEVKVQAQRCLDCAFPT